VAVPTTPPAWPEPPEWPEPPDWPDARLAEVLDAGAADWEADREWLTSRGLVDDPPDLDELCGEAWPGGGGEPRATRLEEALGAGFTHRDAADALGPGPQAGFCAGGVADLCEPCPELAAAAAAAHAAGLGTLSDDELVGLLAAARRLQSWQAAIELSAVAELDRRRTAGRPAASRDDDHVAEELAAALTLTGRAAASLLDLARGLSRLPTVLRDLLAGRIDLARAQVYAAELAALDDHAARACAAGSSGPDRGMTTGQLRNWLRYLVLMLDPRAARERAARAREDARVEVWGEGSGNSALAGRELTPADVIEADARITAIAQALKDAGADGSMDQLRAAVFAALLTGRDPIRLWPALADHPDAAGSTGLSGSVNLVMPLATWLGSSDAPGEAAGHGPVGADTARDLASRLAATGSAARWCVTKVGPDGRAAAHACAHAPPRPGAEASWLDSLRFRVLESGTCSHLRRMAGYRPSGLLAHLVRIRDRSCAFPGCRRPAPGCDLDHTRPYDRGGYTCECNLSPLCRRHHRAKQAIGWRLSQPEPGVLTWTLPHGRSYTKAHVPYLA